MTAGASPSPTRSPLQGVGGAGGGDAELSEWLTDALLSSEDEGHFGMLDFIQASMGRVLLTVVEFCQTMADKFKDAG